MPVNNKSAMYAEREASWNKIRVITAGEEAVKDAGLEYLPKLTGQTTLEYAAYKDRGTFFNATDRTVKGLTGAVMRRDPAVEVPKPMEPFLEDCTLSGLDFTSVVRTAVSNIIGYGYYGILVDKDVKESEFPYMAMYTAFDILNYRVTKIGDQNVLTLLVLREEISAVDSKDSFSISTVEQIRVLSLEEGFLVVRVYQKIGQKGKEDWAQVEVSSGVMDAMPAVRGNRLTYIPFVFFGSVNNEPAPPKPPLLDLVNLNIKHWRVTVDFYHGLHWCALPTPYFFGVEKKKGEIFTIGPSKALTSSNVNAKAGILEFSGQGLETVSKALDRLEEQMAIMGARLLEHKKKGVEAAEALHIRSADESATLITIVGSAENGFVNVLKFAALWMGRDAEEIMVELNKDFIASKLNPQEITSLLQAVQAGKISQDTFLWNLKMGEILPKDRTIEEEKDMLAAEGVDLFEEEEEEEEVVEKEEDEEV